MGFRDPNKVCEAIRKEGGAIEVLFTDDVKPEEMAAIMMGLTNTAQSMGISPGRLFQEYQALAVGAQLLSPGGMDNARN